MCEYVCNEIRETAKQKKNHVRRKSDDLSYDLSYGANSSILLSSSTRRTRLLRGPLRSHETFVKSYSKLILQAHSSVYSFDCYKKSVSPSIGQVDFRQYTILNQGIL